MQSSGGCTGAVPAPIQARNRLGQLPVFRPVALKMLNLLANEEVEVQGIAALLRTDPALSAEVLAFANSAFYGAPHHIDTLARAILVMGFERTRSVTLTVALRSFSSHPDNANIMRLCWQHSMATALLAEELAPIYEVPKDRAYTAALIHDVGRLGLLRVYGDRYAPIFEAMHQTAADCLEYERNLLQMDHCQAGLLLTQQWGFPSDYSRVAGCHHAEMPVAKHDVVSLTHTACQLADALGFPSVTFAQAPSAAAIAAEFPTNPWSPYTFQEVQLRQRIARQIASL